MNHQGQSLSEVIASLPEEERIILTMHYLKSMSTEEIALMLGVPIRSVNVIIKQGKARLNAYLSL